MLHDAGISLATAKKPLAISTPIGTLPWEILKQIFLALQHTPDALAGLLDLPVAHAICGVNSYWRKVATETPALWTHIRIATNFRTYAYPRLLLDRSKGLPIDLYIHHLEQGEGQSQLALPWEVLAFLSYACRKLRNLEMNSWANPTGAFFKVLRIWLNMGSLEAAKRIRLSDFAHSHQQLSLEWGIELSPDEHASNMLHSLAGLDLSYIAFPWSSPAYHGLVDFRLCLSQDNNVRIKTSEISAIFATSPYLTTLKLYGLIVERSNNWNGSTIQLAYLKTFCLAGMSNEGVVLLLSTISLSGCVSNLGISLQIDNPPGIIHVLENFLRDTSTKTLVCSEPAHHHPGSGWGLSLSASIPLLQNLVLPSPALFKLRNTEIKAAADKLRSDVYKLTQLTNQSSRRLPHLFLVSYDVCPELLSVIVPGYCVQALHLEADKPSDDNDYYHELIDMRKELIREFPKLRCTVAQGDTTSEWPCRKY
ncbi:hypothetical protein FRC07_005837 [Ceratobasidium sp. 392]|nr:hypothetical protein FRC07_005837 [Ceratobasidium sp. 392]